MLIGDFYLKLGKRKDAHFNYEIARDLDPKIDIILKEKKDFINESSLFFSENSF